MLSYPSSWACLLLPTQTKLLMDELESNSSLYLHPPAPRMHHAFSKWMANQLGAVEQCALQIEEILFSSLAQSKGIFRKPNLLPLPERALLVMRMLGYTKKKKKKFQSKGQTFQKVSRRPSR